MHCNIYSYSVNDGDGTQIFTCPTQDIHILFESHSWVMKWKMFPFNLPLTPPPTPPPPLPIRSQVNKMDQTLSNTVTAKIIQFQGPITQQLSQVNKRYLFQSPQKRRCSFCLIEPQAGGHESVRQSISLLYVLKRPMMQEIIKLNAKWFHNQNRVCS